MMLVIVITVAEECAVSRWVDAPAMSRLLQEWGPAHFIGELADTIRADFVCGEEVEKSACMTRFSAVGVIAPVPSAHAPEDPLRLTCKGGSRVVLQQFG